MKGYLITLEGQDACGKSKFLELLGQELKKLNINYLTVPEFSSNIIGEFIKKIDISSLFSPRISSIY